LHAAAHNGAAGTLQINERSWKHWEEYCASFNTPPVREQPSEQLAIDRETVLQAGFLPFLAAITEPRASMDSAPKPQSLFNHLLGVRRVHRLQLGIPYDVMKGTKIMLLSHIRAYIALHGPESLVPARKEPFSNSDLVTVLRLPSGTQLGKYRLDWSDFLFVSFKALLCTGLSAAFRKAELCTQDGKSYERGHLSRASVAWRIGGKEINQVSHAQLRKLRRGDLVAIRPPLCKNDPFGQCFSDKAIWLPFDNTETNAAKALAELFLRLPENDTARQTTPLFSITVAGSPLQHSEADEIFKALLRHAFPRMDTSRWSLHSLRIGCASALLAAGAKPDLIQALCRWRSPQSALIYARIGPTDYSYWMDRVANQKVDAITAKRVFDVRIDADAFVAVLNSADDDM
jgi:hypothetical protein